MATATVIRGLECFLCLNLLKEPKLLSCTHSFCKKCLQRLHRSQGMPQKLKCPLCRRITRLGTKGLSDLKTNVPLKSLVGDLKTSIKLCTLCDPEAKSIAVQYCQQCDEYMCETCIQAHENFRKNASHLVVSMDDIKSGTVKVKQMCKEHAGEEKLHYCTSCKVSICFRCRVIDHNGSDHVVHKVEAFKKNMMEEIESLKKKGLEKIEKIKSFTKVVREQSVRVETIMTKREADINKAFDETILQLNLKKNALLDQCKEKKTKLKEKLCKYGKNGDDLISSVSSACELVGNGVRALLDGEALEVHNNLCKELQDMLDRDDPDESIPKHVTSRAEAVTFTPCRLDDEHILGIITIKDWTLEKVAEFPLSGSPRLSSISMAQTKKGQMFVGYNDDSIEEFTVSGPQKRVMNDIEVSGITVLSDGRFVVCDKSDNISLYSIDWKKLHNKHISYVMSKAMDVDKCDNIYAGNNKAIQVFRPEGLELIREIPCHDYKPRRICTMNHSNMLVVSNESSVRVIDQQGTVKHDVTKEGYIACPAVLYDDNILIGWRKYGLVSIDLYTNQLRHVRTVISGLQCNTTYTSTRWALREFSSGEIAFCHGSFIGSKFSVLRKA